MAATDAEALARRLTDLGASVFMTVPPEGRPFLTFDFMTFPPAPAACQLAASIRHRFLTEDRFARGLFGWLYVEGRVHQRFAEHHPGRVVLDVPSATRGTARQAASAADQIWRAPARERPHHGDRT